MTGILRACVRGYESGLRRLVLVMAVLSGAGVIAMMLTTCADVVLRAFGSPLKGSYDIVRLLSLITLACALPYTTAVKGHVAVEFFFNKLPRAGRIVVDTLMRVLLIGLFAVLCYQNVRYGISLRASGELLPTLRLPVFWAAHVVAFSCAVVLLVVLYNLVHPGKMMLKP